MRNWAVGPINGNVLSPPEVSWWCSACVLCSMISPFPHTSFGLTADVDYLRVAAANPGLSHGILVVEWPECSCSFFWHFEVCWDQFGGVATTLPDQAEETEEEI